MIKNQRVRRLRSKLDEKVLRAISARIDGLKAIRAMPYDGFRGKLPDWMPDPLVQEFRALQSDLVDWYEEWAHLRTRSLVWYVKAGAALLGFMEARARELTWPKLGGSTFYPPKILERLDSLNYIKHLADIGLKSGPDEAIATYLGRSGLRVYRGIVQKQQAEAMTRSSAAKRAVRAADRAKKIMEAVERAKSRGVKDRAINKTVASEQGISAQFVGKVRRNVGKLKPS